MAQTVADKERMGLNPLFPIYSSMVVFEEESFVGNLQRVEVMRGKKWLYVLFKRSNGSTWRMTGFQLRYQMFSDYNRLLIHSLL
jgi:hypothetical protein